MLDSSSHATVAMKVGRQNDKGFRIGQHGVCADTLFPKTLGDYDRSKTALGSVNRDAVSEMGTRCLQY
jgi:hypothetical protein